MKIRRRINKGKKEVIENAELISKTEKNVTVRLGNGDIIKRKIRDIVEW